MLIMCLICLFSEKPSWTLPLYDYVHESEDPHTWFSLIRCSEYYAFANSECERILELSLFEYYVKLSVTHASDEDLISRFYDDIIAALLEEIDVKEISVKKMFQLLKEENFHKSLGVMQYVQSDTFSNAKFRIHDILCLMVCYIKPKNIEQDLKERLLEIPMLEIIINMTQLNEDEFVGSFNQNKIFSETYVKNLDTTTKKSECMFFIACFEVTWLICAIINPA